MELMLHSEVSKSKNSKTIVMKNSRRDFLKKTAKSSAGIYIASLGFSAKSYANIIGANDRVRLGVIGFSDRFKYSHLPSFLHYNKELNFDIVAVSDIWKRRREEGEAFLKSKLDHSITACKNNEALYALKNIDGVFVSTADCIVTA